jgi:hypothetical protein
MAKESEIMRKRREAREAILALKDQIPSAKILNLFGRFFARNATNRTVIYWVSNFVILHLLMYGLWIALALVINELEEKTYLWKAAVLAAEMQIIGLILNYHLIRRFLDSIADQIVAKINNVDDLSRFVAWLSNSLSATYVILFTLGLELIWTSLGVGAISIVYNDFVGYGFSLAVIFIGVIAGVALHGVYWDNFLIFNLRTYQYELNAFSPADSEIISDITDICNVQLYGLALYFAFYNLFSATGLVESKIRLVFAIPFFIIIWVTIFSQFLAARTTLGHIINKAKWKTLNKIQIHINSIEATNELSEKEASEKLLRLADIHRRVMASKSNIFDLKSISTFFSQLMLPLLGLLLGNLDKILELLR